MYFCQKCGKELKNAGAKAVHQKNCNGGGSKLDVKKQLQKEICPKCGLRILASKQKHYDTCDGTGPKRLKPKKGYNPWNKNGIENYMSKKYGEEKGKIKTKEYKIKISKALIGKPGHPCSEETKEKLKKRTNFGIVKRSKNEIYFGELCSNYFKKVLLNECIFNGWDADVIIEDIKVAILWNGKWHYEKIMKKHSLEQVKNRDKIKINEIKKAGYTPYIIKDMGKHNKEFVENEFEKFKRYVYTDIA